MFDDVSTGVTVKHSSTNWFADVSDVDSEGSWPWACCALSEFGGASLGCPSP